MAEVRRGFTSFSLVVMGSADPPLPGTGLEASPVPGGSCFAALPTNAMNIGDAVSFDTGNQDQVKKDRTMQFAGICVGSTPSPSILAPQQTGALAAAGQFALIQYDGIVIANVDNSAILIGSMLKQSGATDGLLTLDGAPSVAGTVAVAVEANGSQAGTIKVKLIQ